MEFRIHRTDKTPHSPETTPKNESWERQTLRDVLLEAYKEQRRARLWRNIWRGVGVFIFFSILMGAMQGGNSENTNGQNSLAAQSEHTAVIELSGVIGGDEFVNHVDILRDGMEAAYKNKHAKAIIIRANSPGGSPVVSNIAFQEIQRLKNLKKNIPVYVVMEDMCASGCYYIAAAADKIYADPSTLVGSIGVIGSSFDATGLMDKLGVKRRQRIAGNNKGMGDPFSPETSEQQAIWQQMLNQIHEEFIKAVRAGRGAKLKESENPDLFSGRVYTGIEGRKVGLVDDFGNVYSVARDVVKAEKLVDYTPQQDDFMRLLTRGLGAKVSTEINNWIHQIW
ncbi:S49 family peptidase [Alysiella crassa]|uniref:Protease 4 n=1 Tax=Alysiella crassa TaxID=153491 RepID=A0A376BLT8_9NEIS|nr:S49 family peptidase [Alysiella crassa]UOP08150.1 S49 family peptidase [Alysiella crassa]SSY70646.1 Protease 4 [Alysiella crassa]